MLTRAAIVLALLLAAGVYGSRAGSAETVVPRAPLAALPLAIGEWQGHEAAPLEDDVLAQLGVDDYVSREYGHQGSAAVGGARLPSSPAELLQAGDGMGEPAPGGVGGGGEVAHPQGPIRSL